MKATNFYVDKADASLFAITLKANKNTKPGQPLKWREDSDDVQAGTFLIDIQPRRIVYGTILGQSVQITILTNNKESVFITDKNLLKQML